MTIQRQTAGVRIAADLYCLAFFVAIAAADGLVFRSALQRSLGPLDFGLAGVALFSTHLLVIALLRLFVPVPEPGTHLVKTSGGYGRWLASSALAEVALHPLVRAPFWPFHFGRWLYLKALGAQLELGVTIPPSLFIRDPALLVMEMGAQIEPGVLIEPALHSAGRLVVARVVVGGGSLIGAHATLLAGAAVGEDARIGPAAFIGRSCKVGVGAFIGERAVLEEGVDVGSYAVIGAGAVVGAGVAIGERAKVVAGSNVPAGRSVEDRDVWEGALPARVEAFEPPTPPVPLPLNLLLREASEDAASEDAPVEAPLVEPPVEAPPVEVPPTPEPKRLTPLPRVDTDQVRERAGRRRGMGSEVEAPALERPAELPKEGSASGEGATNAQPTAAPEPVSKAQEGDKPSA
ncbi:MAG: hypothetical protein HY791_21905 [Deltaproteobacteria bacterium]|nr:hypothetical protein [Deltaproteobacteria bacterium]